MKKDLLQIIEIPEGVEVKVDGTEIIVKGKEGELKRNFESVNISFELKDNKVELESKKATKREKKMMNTIKAHIQNMIKGVQEKFEYKMKVCNSHFPMNVEVKGKEAVIKNFLGEKIPRKVKILEGTDVKIERDVIIISSTNKELAGQTAGNFEKATFVKGRDRRVFQDGIFITSKPGRDI